MGGKREGIARRWHLSIQVINREAFDYIFRSMREVLEKGDATLLQVEVQEVEFPIEIEAKPAKPEAKPEE